MTQTYRYDPENYLVTTIRSLKEYVEDAFFGSVRDGDGNSIGNGTYEVVMEFPSDEDILKFMPLSKTIVHLEIDDIDSRVLGFGENIAKTIYDKDTMTITQQEASTNVINFDVGIWASDKSGGTTARLKAYQLLQFLFLGSLATERLYDATNANDGALEIVSFGGGRFVRETINDIPVFRVVNCTLVIRVFSRTPYLIPIPTIEDIVQNPELVISPHLTLNDEPIGD